MIFADAHIKQRLLQEEYEDGDLCPKIDKMIEVVLLSLLHKKPLNRLVEIEPYSDAYQRYLIAVSNKKKKVDESDNRFISGLINFGQLSKAQEEYEREKGRLVRRRHLKIGRFRIKLPPVITTPAQIHRQSIVN